MVKASVRRLAQVAARKLLSEQDTAFYSELSARWWEPRGPFYALRLYNSVRVPFIEDAVRRAYSRPVELASIQRYMKPERERDENLFSDKLLLDVGCGGGLLAEALAMRGFMVTGIDAAQEGVQAANAHRLQQLVSGTTVEGTRLSVAGIRGLQNLRYIHSDLGEIRQRSRTSNTAALAVKEPCKSSSEPPAVRDGFKEGFHIVVASEVIEHVDDPRHFMSECLELLKPGGVFVLTTPNRTFISHFFVIFCAEMLLQIVPRGTHLYTKFLRPQELIDFAREICPVKQLNTTGTFYIPGIGLWFTTRFNWNSYMLALMKL